MIIAQIIAFCISILWVIIKIIIFITQVIIFLIWTLWIVWETIIFITHYYIKKTNVGSGMDASRSNMELGGDASRPISMLGEDASGPEDLKDGLQASMLIFPINSTGGKTSSSPFHWTLLVFDMEVRTWTFYNSWLKGNSNDTNFVQDAKMVVCNYPFRNKKIVLLYKAYKSNICFLAI